MEVNSKTSEENKSTTPKIDDESQQFSPILRNMGKELIEGVVYQKFWSEIPISEMFKIMKTFEVFDDDVLTTGMPRSGSHWAYDVVYMIRHQTTEFGPKNFVDDILDIRLFTSQGGDDFKRPRTLATHDRPRRFPAQAIEKRIKMIFLLRNPKDVLVSMFNFWSQLKRETDRFEGTWDEFIDLAINGQFSFGSWIDHTLDVEKFIEDNPQIPTYVHVYEHMKEKPVESIRKLCAFLEKPDILAEEIAATVEFDRMRATAKKFDRAETFLFGGKKSPAIMRKGLIGDWMNNFTVAQNEKFNRVYKEKMFGSKLAKLIEKYIELE